MDEVKLSPVQEDHKLDWLKDNDAIWRRGSNNYKDQKQLWQAYVDDVGIELQDLENSLRTRGTHMSRLRLKSTRLVLVTHPEVTSQK